MRVMRVSDDEKKKNRKRAPPPLCALQMMFGGAPKKRVALTENNKPAIAVAVVEDPFSVKFRSSLCQRALCREWQHMEVVDERSHSGPFEIELRKQTATKPERKVMRYRETTSPFDFGRRFDYLGHGRFGSVFRVEDVAIKVETKKSRRLPWEAMAFDLYWTRKKKSTAQPAGDLPMPSALYLWRDANALAMPVFDASLADALTQHRERLSQPVALYYAVAAMQAVAGLHAVNILHCDIKPDNFLLKFPADRKAPKVDDWRRLAHHGFRLVLVDLGRSVDLDECDRTARFASTKTHVDEYEWPPAKKAKESWRHEVDVYALGVVVFVTACARPPPPMQQHYASCIPRGWDRTFWEKAFKSLLGVGRRNVHHDDTLPPHLVIPNTLRVAVAALDDALHVRRRRQFDDDEAATSHQHLENLKDELFQIQRHLRGGGRHAAGDSSNFK